MSLLRGERERKGGGGEEGNFAAAAEDRVSRYSNITLKNSSNKDLN
jgi:hypothetical protein